MALSDSRPHRLQFAYTLQVFFKYALMALTGDGNNTHDEHPRGILLVENNDEYRN